MAEWHSVVDNSQGQLTQLEVIRAIIDWHPIPKQGAEFGCWPLTNPLDRIDEGAQVLDKLRQYGFDQAAAEVEADWLEEWLEAVLQVVGLESHPEYIGDWGYWEEEEDEEAIEDAWDDLGKVPDHCWGCGHPLIDDWLCPNCFVG